ncbi:hypothetical protein BJP05_03705 [Corynebacterium sp. NML98-0116]|uniref:Secreted protein n=2 Tax=Corynebacterium TaxID=1716 RepID=A0ABD4TQF4_9CORY|nr:MULTISPECIES: hypothetical protein [Corynebacterium]AOX05373.1 hypothetical protein BJP05_03705 [Corynebacterium sp. NML98-0116]MCO6393437.1 hypothetical protein [Corynebacterium lipophilum]MCQ4607630.1 hypothetical protein [Corynebacterium pseudogenitalium]MCQ4608922.1 hypothetical protein [Corynebacterium sp. CCUG 61414]MCQ4611015.1 hypothetical protein [Corynebacterium sp. CCUG 51687]
MTMQPRPSNPIESRKQAVRRYSKNAVVWAGGGLGAGVALGLIAGSWQLFIVCLVIGVVGGYINWSKVQKIVNHHDNY